MISLTGLQHRFGFTRSEAGVILFLSVSLLAGAGIRWIRAGDAEAGDLPPAFDYGTADSEFSARSAAAGSDTALPAARSHPFARKPPPPVAPVDVNLATAPELLRLPGIGEAMARRIIAHREHEGPFRSVDDLLRVPGIGQKKLGAIRPFVTVR